LSSNDFFSDESGPERDKKRSQVGQGN
jgi:hypothetical protein